MMALRMFSESFSLANFAEWTHITTSCLSYFFSRKARSGSTCMQLMQQKVQKSRSTTLPRRSFMVISPLVFSQPEPPSSSGALKRLGKGFSGRSPAASAAAAGRSPSVVFAAGALFFALSAGGAPAEMRAENPPRSTTPATIRVPRMRADDRALFSSRLIQNRSPSSSNPTASHFRQPPALCWWFQDEQSNGRAPSLTGALHFGGSLQGAQLAGNLEVHVLLTDRDFFDFGSVLAAEKLHAFLNDHFRGAGARGDQHAPRALEPFRPQLGNAVDQIRRPSLFGGDLLQAQAVGAVAAPQHDHHVGLGGQGAHRFLPVRRRVADVFLRRTDDVREALLQALDHPVGFVHAERRLCEVSQFRSRRNFEPIDVGGRIDQNDVVGGFTHRPDDLVVPLVPDQHNPKSLVRKADRFEMHLRHQGTGGIDGLQAPLPRQLAHLRGNPVGAVEQNRPFGHVFDGIDERHSLL